MCSRIYDCALDVENERFAATLKLKVIDPSVRPVPYVEGQKKRRGKYRVIWSGSANKDPFYLSKFAKLAHLGFTRFTRFSDPEVRV